MFRLINNILFSFFYSIWSIFMTMVTGKLVKVSAYHSENSIFDSTVFNITNDKHIKIDQPYFVSEECKIRIIKYFIDHLERDENLTSPISDSNCKFPMFDGSRIIGESNVHSVINKSLKDYIKNQRK